MKQIQTRSTVMLLTGVLLATLPALAQEPETETTIAGNAKLDNVLQQAFSKHYGEGARTTAVLIATPQYYARTLAAYGLGARQ